MSGTSSASNNSSVTYSTAISLIAFGIVSAITTQLERRKQRQKKSQAPEGHFQVLLQSPPPSASRHLPESIVAYLHKHGGKQWQTSYSVNTEEFVRACPKVELHVHLDGSLDPDFLWHCLRQYDEQDHNVWISCLPVSTTLPWDPQHPLPVRHLVKTCPTIEDFHQLCTCRRGQRSLQNMLTCFEIFLPLIRGAPPALFLVEELAYDFCKRQWEQNVVYTEVRHCPHLLMREDDKTLSGSFDMDTNDVDDNDAGINSEYQKRKEQKHRSRLESARKVLQAITRGLQRGCSDYNIVVNQILCCINWRPDWAWDILELAQEFRRGTPCGVVGIDIAAGEEHFDPKTFPDLYQAHYDVMQKAQALDIPIAIHAGETPNGLEHVRKAVKKGPGGYGAKRIGHGYRMEDSVALMQQLARDKIHVEICPTSSVETGGWIFDESMMVDDSAINSSESEQPLLSAAATKKKRKPWKDHPSLKFLEHGIPISINSDDPAVFHTSLSWQYRIALTKMGLTREQIMQSNLDALNGSFAAQEDIAKIRCILITFADKVASRANIDTLPFERFTDRVRHPS